MRLSWLLLPLAGLAASTPVLDARGTCPTPDTPTAFQTHPPFLSLSPPTPKGYTRTFNNLTATVTKLGFLSLVTPGTYAPRDCASSCDTTPTCGSLNIYLERDITPIPDVECVTPEMRVWYRCSLWNGVVDEGMTRVPFEVLESSERRVVAVVASSGYVRKKGEAV